MLFTQKTVTLLLIKKVLDCPQYIVSGAKIPTGPSKYLKCLSHEFWLSKYICLYMVGIWFQYDVCNKIPSTHCGHFTVLIMCYYSR